MEEPIGLRLTQKVSQPPGQVNRAGEGWILRRRHPRPGDSKVHMVKLDEGQAIFFICPACGRLQRPRLIKDNQFFLVNLSDEQMHTLQFLYKMNL